jgi:hypothetical protein
MTTTSTTSREPATPVRVVSWRTLLLVYVGSIALYVLHGLAFRLHNYDSTSVGADVVLFVVSGLFGLALVGALTFLVHRFGSPVASGRAGVVLGLLAAVAYVPLYYTPWSLIWGVTAALLGEEAGPGRLRTAARVFAAIAVLEVVVTTVAWLLGSGWHPGCSAQDCHPR